MTKDNATSPAPRFTLVITYTGSPPTFNVRIERSTRE